MFPLNMLGLARRRKRRVGMAKRRPVKMMSGRGVFSDVLGGLRDSIETAVKVAPYVMPLVGMRKRRAKQRGRGILSDIKAFAYGPAKKFATDLANKATGLAAQAAIKRGYVTKETANELRKKAVDTRKKYLGFSKRLVRRRMAGRAYNQLLF